MHSPSERPTPTFVALEFDGRAPGPVDGAMANREGTVSSGPKRRGPVRQGILVLLSCVAVWLVGAGTYQVLTQALGPGGQTTTLGCREGASALLSVLQVARERSAEQILNEREALATFRANVTPVWSQAPAIRARCEEQQDKVALEALRSLELLRYAEERSIRLSAVDLTQLRRLTPRLVYALSTKSP
jgi:hypothetical protein